MKISVQCHKKLELHLAFDFFQCEPRKTNQIQGDFSISHYQFLPHIIKIHGFLQNQGSRFCWAIGPQDHCVRATLTAYFMGYEMKWQQIYIHVISMPDWYWSDCTCQLAMIWKSMFREVFHWLSEVFCT